MDSLISKTNTEKIVNSSEHIFDKCFDMLLAFKSCDISISNTIEKFRPTLAEALYSLMSFYKKLKAERQHLISQKSCYSTARFRTIMAENDLYSKTIRETIKIGKSLGDAFAWLFYQENLPELLKHFEHPSTGLYVGDLGGLGELEFIKHNQILSGLFVIYHGTTSILRVGDFSLYAPGYGIVGLGELKTEPAEHGIKISAYISSKVNIRGLDESKRSQSISIGKLTSMPKAFPNLKRQLAVQDRLLFHSKSDKNTAQPTKYDYQLIEKLSVENPLVHNEDNSLMLMRFSNTNQNLFQILSTQEICDSIPAGFQSAAQKLIVPEYANNRFIIGNINTEASYLRIPPFWWNIDSKICKEIYFRRIHFVTLFNPARLIQHMEDRGFHLTDDSTDRQKINLIKTIKDRKIELHGFNLFFDLISYGLMELKYVEELVDNVIADIENGKYPPNTKIEMIVQQSIFPPSTDH